MSGTSDLKALV